MHAHFYLMSQNTNYQMFTQFKYEDACELGEAILDQDGFRASLSPSQGIALVFLRQKAIKLLMKRVFTLFNTMAK